MNPPSPRKFTGKSELDLLLYAVNHPLRRQILRDLVKQDGSAKVVAARIGANPTGVSYHLNTVLARQCNVVRLVDAVQRRGGVEKIYAIRERRLWAPELWQGLPPRVGVGLQQFSLREFLSHVLAAIDQERAPLLEWQAVSVDALGWQEITDAADSFRRTVDAAVTRTQSQAPASVGEPTIKVITGVATFRPADGAEIERWGIALDDSR